MACSSVLTHKRIMAGILGMLMLFIMLFSAFYIADEADHDCTGESCPICACIQQCENTLHQIGNGIAFQIAIIIPIVLMSVCELFLDCVFPHETLISKKVRLNN